MPNLTIDAAKHRHTIRFLVILGVVLGALGGWVVASIGTIVYVILTIRDILITEKEDA